MLVGIMHSVVVPFRALIKEELVIEGLSSGRDAALDVRQEGIAGMGVFATEAIKKGSWLCEYKTTRVFNRSELKQVEAEYLANNEGSYIVEAAYAVGKEGHLCFDATRKYHQFGRYINHAKKANAMITPPFMVRGKWKIGFVAVIRADKVARLSPASTPADSHSPSARQTSLHVQTQSEKGTGGSGHSVGGGLLDSETEGSARPQEVRSACSSPPSTSADLHNQSARQTSRHGRTDAAGTFPFELPFFLSFSEFLSSRTGGKKSPKQIDEVCTDVSKYLWFANPETLDTDTLFSRVKIREYVTELESGGIGPSGVLSKLRRISMAIRHEELCEEDMATEVETTRKASLVKNLISNICTGLSREKSTVHRTRLTILHRTSRTLQKSVNF